MAFQLKDFVSIAASIINHAKATQNTLTDFNIGSVARTMLESPAIEIEELYQQMWNGLQESIPISVFNSFDFAALSARSATGLIRLSVTSSTSALSIPGGTVFSTTDSQKLRFASISDATVPVGATYVDIKVVAASPGLSGNIDIGTGFTVSPAVSGFVSAVAANGFIDGMDAETILERKARFVEYVSTLARGTPAALRYGAKTAKIYDSAGFVIEEVKGSAVIEPWLTDNTQTPGLVYLYIYNGSDGASGNLIGEVSKVIDGYYDANGSPVAGWKAAGVKVVVGAATLVSIPVTGTVTVASGYSSSAVKTAVSEAIASYIAGLEIGGDVIQSEIVAIGMGVDGVINFRVTAPSADTVIAINAKAVVGTITLTMN